MALLLPGVAVAHTGGEVHSFVAGVMHPLGGMDHLMAMLAVGLLAGCAGGWMRWALPATFVAAMAMGAVLGANGIETPLVEVGIAFSLVAFGAALVTQRALSAPLMIVFTAGFAMFHGHAHGTEMGAGLAALPYAMGFMIATALLHAKGVLLTTSNLLSLKQLTLRKWSGGAIAAAGIASFCVTIVSA